MLDAAMAWRPPGRKQCCADRAAACELNGTT
jgi:hypothetical protein